MKVTRALLSGKEYPSTVAELMWMAIDNHGFDYIGAAFSTMRGGHYDADVSVAGVACSFTLVFDSPEELRRFIADVPFAPHYDEQAATAAYRRIGAAAGLAFCMEDGEP